MQALQSYFLFLYTDFNFIVLFISGAITRPKDQRVQTAFHEIAFRCLSVMWLSCSVTIEYERKNKAGQAL